MIREGTFYATQPSAQLPAAAWHTIQGHPGVPPNRSIDSTLPHPQTPRTRNWSRIRPYASWSTWSEIPF